VSLLASSGSLDELGDAELVSRIVARDERALVAVYDRHGATLFGIAVRFLGDRESAAEVVQEVFLSLWQRAARFDAAAGTLIAWLIGIARHRSLDRLRAASRRPRTIQTRSDPWSTAGSGPDGLAGAYGGRAAIASDESGTDPSVEIDRRWTRSVVRASLAELPDAERRVLILAYDEGLSQSEIAARLGLPIGTVKSRTRRAMAIMRARLTEVPELMN
jgi:RNA polymerase sigma-70 factor (ECF subfamily)